MLYDRLFLCIPLPAIAEVLRNDARHLAEFQCHGLYIRKLIFLCDLFDLLYYISNYTQLVHNVSFQKRVWNLSHTLVCSGRIIFRKVSS